MRRASVLPAVPALPVLAVLALLGPAVAGCRRDDPDRERRRAEIAVAMKKLMADRLAEWRQAAAALQAAAPVAPGRGWDPAADAAAIAAMKQAWSGARDAYERIEGAVAPLFPESDTATDSRYDDFQVVAGGGGDRQPFDGEGVVGMHAIERVLWADRVPAPVLAFERALKGYRPAAFPATHAEAVAFRDGLAARLVADTAKLEADFAPLDLDVAFALQGLIDLAREQLEKVDKAATGQEESRYAQATMRDLRANLTGCREAYALFRPWLVGKKGADNGADKSAAHETAREVEQAFARLDAAYRTVPGDAIPAPPPGWSAVDPRPADLQSVFGKLFSLVRSEVDPKARASLVSALGKLAERLDLPPPLR
jgi:iron uptake system component EfeO